MATTTDTVEQMGKSAEALVRSARQSANTAMDYTVKAQEVNTELLRKTTEAWIQGLRKQTELSQDMTQEFFEKAEDQARAYQDFFGQWGFPFMSFPLVRMPYDPSGFLRVWRQNVRKSARDTRRAAWDAQKTSA